MLSKKLITNFVLRCLVFYGIFLALSGLGVNQFYANYFQSFANKWVQPLSNLDIEFRDNQESDKAKFNIETVVMHQDTIQAHVQAARQKGLSQVHNIPSVTMAFSSTRQGYIPTIFLLSLILATPIRFRWIKASALFWGMLLLHAYLIFKFSIWIIHQSTTVDTLGLSLANNPFWEQVLHYLYLSFSADMPLRYIMPVLIWMLVCIRKEDLAKISRSVSNMEGAL